MKILSLMTLCRGILVVSSLWVSQFAYSQCRPNFLICISDDQSWIHTSSTGDPVVKTPHFDRVAREGILFTEAYSAASSCTPSRSAILTGRNIYELESGAILGSYLPGKFTTYQDILENSGYHVGFAGKGTLPGYQFVGGRTRDPAGPSYNRFTTRFPPGGVNPNNYGANFEHFLSTRQEGQPFSFWMGSFEPHRPYYPGQSIKEGIDTSKIVVPDFLPDVSAAAKTELADYLYEIQHFDAQLGRMMAVLDSMGELENTIIIVTSDNGMPFPRAKTELYEYGVHVPLAVRWGKRSGRVVKDFVSLKDIAPTFLEAAGIDIPPSMTAKSFLNILESNRNGLVDSARMACFVANERHGKDKRPRRGVYTEDFAYIHNFPCCLEWPSSLDSAWSVQAFEGSRNNFPYSTILWRFRQHPKIKPYFELYRGTRKEHELYDRKNDPFQLKNLAYQPEYQHLRDSLSQLIADYSIRTGDPRAVQPNTLTFDGYQYFDNDWKAKNRVYLNQMVAKMEKEGAGKLPGNPVPLPESSPGAVQITAYSVNPPDSLGFSVDWNPVQKGKDILKYRIYFYTGDSMKIGPMIGEVCMGTHIFSTSARIHIPDSALFVGVASVNQSGEFLAKQNLALLVFSLGNDEMIPPTNGPVSLTVSAFPRSKILWEFTSPGGMMLKSDSRKSGGFKYQLEDDISSWKTGVYFLKVRRGKKISTYRIVKI